MVSWHGLVLKEVEMIWKNLRLFCYFNKSFTELSFILLYALEQAVLVYFSFKINNLQQLGLVVAIFAIVVLTTFAIHKIIMESRIKMLEEELKGLTRVKYELSLEKEGMQKKHEELLKLMELAFSKGLNMLDPDKAKRGGR